MKHLKNWWEAFLEGLGSFWALLLVLVITFLVVMAFSKH